MKHFYLLLVAIFFSVQIHSQNAPFITTWEVTAGSLDITIPTTGTGYNYTIDFGDGTVQNNVTGNITHTYSSAGIYYVSITGSFPRIYFYFSTAIDISKLLSVEQWGDIQWKSMEYAFRMCKNLVINATDAPNLTQVTNLSYMFVGATSFNQSINHWDVSNIKLMEGMFFNASNFNQPLNNWNVSNVTNMNRLFYGASNFNQPLNNWNVSKVTNMNLMFSNASSFNQSLNNWDVSKVTQMSTVFNKAISFNQSLNNWDVSNVVTMRFMFAQATNFNQPLSNWNVVNVNNMEGMFREATSFNQPLNNWNIVNVTNMKDMFSDATSFNSSIDNWNVSNVKNISYMFRDATSFNQPLNSWNVINVNTMEGLFYNATSFNQPIGNWNTSNTTNMELVFYGATSFNQPLNNWDVSNVTQMRSMFLGATSFNQFLNNWNVSNIINMRAMFSAATSFNQPLNDWDVSNVILMDGMFSGAISFNQPLNNWDVSIGPYLDSMFQNAVSFNQPLDSWDVSNVIDMANMFEGATMFNQDLSNWVFNPFVNLHYFENNKTHFLSNTSMSVQNYDALLERFVQLGLQDKKLGADGLLYCDITSRNVLINNLGWEIYNDNIYTYCGQLGNLITTWVITSNDLSLTIPTHGSGYNYDIDFGDGNFQTGITGNVTHTFNAPGIYLVVISGDFPKFYFNNSGDKNKLLTIEQWGEIKWHSMENAFYGCENLEVTAIDAPDLSQVSDMSAMFKKATSFNQPVFHWDVSNIIYMDEIFSGAASFNQDVSVWNFNPNISLVGFLSYSGIDVTNYDYLLSSFANSGLQNKTLGAHDLEFCNTVSRDTLIFNLGWNIDGDNLNADCNMNMHDNNLIKSIVIYPVPANDILYINKPQGVTLDRMSLYNLQGQIIQNFKGDYQDIHVNQLAEGVYFLKFYSSNQSHIIQFVKK